MTKGSKAQSEQGSMGQGSKGVTLGVVASECPAVSYVSSFLNLSFAGFLFGRVFFL